MKFFLVIALSSLLAASVEAQSGCLVITESELGDTGAISASGLIAERLGTPIRLISFKSVCSVTAGSRDLYREVSLVATYTTGGDELQAQFEFGCTDDTWRIEIRGSTNDTVTIPPNALIGGVLILNLRTDCHQCASPDRLGFSINGNHCQGTLIAHTITRRR